MANSGHLKPEEVNELVNLRNREKRQKVPHHMDVDGKAKNVSPKIDEVKEPEVEASLKEDPLKLSNLEKGVEIIYTKSLENQKDKEKVTFVVERFMGSGGYAKTYLVNLKMMDNMPPMIIKEFCPQSAVRDRKNHLLFNREDTKIEHALEDFKKEPQRINKLLEKTPKEKWESLNLVISHTENTFTCFGNEYYVMEYVSGEPLTQLMKKNGENILPENKLGILKELCVAVNNLHRIPCVHQDLSANNILVDNEKDGLIKLKVIDFGMSTTLDYQEGRGYSIVREGGTPGFWDFRNFANYKTWSDSNNEERKRLKLIDIYSLGAVLAYVYLLPSEYYSDPDNGFEALDYLIATDRCGAEQTVLPTDAPADEKAKILYNMVRKLAADATHPNVDERIPTVDEFMERLQVIIDYLTPPSEKEGLKEALQTLQKELEDVQKSREQKENEYHLAMKARIEEIEGQQRKLKELENSLKAKDEVSKQEVQDLQVRLQEEQARLGKELEQKERDRMAEKKHWEEELAKYEQEKRQARGKEQELTQRVKFLTKQLEKEKRLRLEQGAKYEEEQKKVRQLLSDLYKQIEELNRKKSEEIKAPDEEQLMKTKQFSEEKPSEMFEVLKLEKTQIINLENSPLPWYKRYKQPLLIALVVIGMAGVATGVGSIDWNSDATQLKDSDTELQVQPVENVSSSVQSAEADINVSQQLQPEQLTALIQRARKNERTRRYLEDELCDREVIVLEEKEGVPVRIPTLQLFNELSDNYPIVGITHKVAELHYENGKIKLITLIKIK